MESWNVYHIAWRANDFDDHIKWQKEVMRKGFQKLHKFLTVNAIYFREFGGILFEIAADPPGFAK